MKINITDNFLWDIFNSMSEIEDVLHFLIHPPRKMSDIFFDKDNPVYRRYYKSLNPQKFAQFIYYLKRNNYIKVKSLENKMAIIITKKGII